MVDGQEDLGPDPSRPGEHIFKPKTRRLLIYSDPQAFKDGYVVLLADDAPAREFLGRRITSPDLLDPQQLRTWLHNCETTHGVDCQESLVHPTLLGEPKDVFRAVDVVDMCIVEVPITARYVALSYLWGKNFNQLFTTSKNLAKLSQPGALEKEKIPRTIKDTIKLTKMLGERYLWTDSLALLHDDGFQYHDDWVYSRAALTVVAGSGKDANAGLPGVRKESRTFHQEIEQVKPGLRVMVSHLAEGASLPKASSTMLMISRLHFDVTMGLTGMDLPRTNVVKTSSAVRQRTYLLPVPANDVLRRYRKSTRQRLVPRLDRYAYEDISREAFCTVHLRGRTLHKKRVNQRQRHIECF